MSEGLLSTFLASWLRWNGALILVQIVTLVLLVAKFPLFTVGGKRVWSVYSLIYAPGATSVEQLAGVNFTFDGTPGLGLVLFALYAVGPAFLIALWRHPIFVIGRPSR